MRLQFLGTGGYHPNERRHTACLLFPELGVIFDAGSSAFRIASRTSVPEIEIFLTHPHLDHIVGLTFLLVPMLKGEITHCRIHASPGTIAAVKQHLFSDPLFPVLPDFEFVDLADEVIVGDDKARITHHPLNHPGGSLGFRLDSTNKTFAYITDTIADGSYTDFIRGVDVLAHECNFPDEMAEWGPKTGHSYTSQVVGIARDAAVKRLFLTHIDPQRSDDDPIGMAKARSIFPETYLAEDFLEVEI